MLLALLAAVGIDGPPLLGADTHESGRRQMACKIGVVVDETGIIGLVDNTAVSAEDGSRGIDCQNPATRWTDAAIASVSRSIRMVPVPDRSTNSGRRSGPLATTWPAERKSEFVGRQVRQAACVGVHSWHHLVGGVVGTLPHQITDPRTVAISTPLAMPSNRLRSRETARSSALAVSSLS